MTQRTLWLLLLLPLVFSEVSFAEETGKVTLPLSMWQAMRDRLEAAQKPETAPVAVSAIERQIEGSFRKGLFSGTLTYRFAVEDTRGHVRVPVLDAGAAMGEVALDGKTTSLLAEGGMYTVGVDQPGVHELRARFFWGREQDRFARLLSFSLPPAGVTRVSVLIPESDIEAKLARGAIISADPAPGGTRVEGALDASGRMSLSWNRKITHRSREKVQTEFREQVLLTLQEAMVDGLAVFDVDVLQGELDRLELVVPEGLDVVSVDGGAVLQWAVESGAASSPAANGTRLNVLLRYLVERHMRFSVRFQFQTEEGKPLALRLPLPPPEATFTGNLGILAPAGYNVQVAERDAEVQELAQRELPPELTDLTQSPLLLGFAFSKPPRLSLSVTRNQDVTLLSTVIDELEASSVLIEDGTEITKLKLRVRNNRRQYLTVRLPEGAVLTHSQLEGRPVRPAVTGSGAEEALLFPLRQSEKVGRHQTRLHVVRPDETLSEIANFYFGNPNEFNRILEGNRDQLSSADGLYVGQQLRIPASTDVNVEESNFVIELAYRRERPALGSFGRRELLLPSLDVEAQKAVWHLYLPEHLEALSFDANLAQYSHVRYDHFRRVRDFLYRALFERNAFAGGGYVSVLKLRKDLYYSESGRQASSEVVLSSFPLVGERYRFRRALLGREVPRIRVTYADQAFGTAARWLSLLLPLALGLLLLHGRRSLGRFVGAGAVLLLLLFAGYYFNGVHRRILWGVDLALLLSLLWMRGRPFWQGLRRIAWEPWRVVEIVTLRNLAFLVGCCVILWFVLLFPLLLSSTAAVALYLWWRRKERLRRQEVAHA
ncbi:MAG: LysM peptidoglycan-binding domain-containing protein [Myxococcales bacterium]|nr:LysM peptidoglycan-binding domain-containing protein [Myxococcales bacterium]